MKFKHKFILIVLVLIILNSSFITSLPYETPVKYMFSQTHANFNNPSGAYYNNQRSAGDTCVEDSDCNSGACKRELYVHSIDLCKGWNIPFNEEGCMSAIFSCVRDDFQCSKWSSKNYYGFNTGYTESGIYCAGNNLVGVKKNYGKECTENYECRYACANSIDDDKKYCIKDSTSKCSGKDVVGYELNKQLNEYTCLKIGDTSDLNSYYDGILQANNGESCSTNIDCKSNNCLKEIDSENSFCAESGKQCSNQGETGFTIGEKLVVSDSEYYGCTGLSESKLVTENGFACNTNEECGSNNCVKEIDSENSFCADIGKQCSNQGENGFDIGERLTISDTEYYKCTGLSESKLVTENGFACNTNEECGSNNCVKEIDSENLFCADTGKECSKQNENGYEQGNILNGYQCIGLSQSGLASGYDCNSDSDCLTQSCIIDIFDQSQTGKVCELINLASIGVSLSLDEAEGNSYLYENEIGEKIKWYDWSLRNVYGKKTYFYLKNIENIENFDSANLYIKPNNREIEKTYIANKISDTEYRVHIPYNDCYRRNNCLTDYPIDRVENYSYYWILRDKAGKLNKLKTEIFEVTKEEAITPAISIENKLIYTNSKKYDNAVFSDNTITSNYDFKIEINHNGKKEIYDGIRDFYYRPNELGTYTFNLSNNPESEWRFTGYSEKITMEFTKPPYPQLFNYGYMNNQIIFPNKEKPQITQIHEGYQIFNETINLKLILDGQIIDLIKNKEIINDGLNMYFIYDGNKWKQGEYGSSISQQIIINYTDEFEPGKHEIYFSVTDPFGQTTNTPRRTVTVEKKTYDFDIILDGDQLFGAHPLDYSEIIIKKNQDNSVSYKIDIINQNKNLIFTKEISNGIDAKIYYEFPEDGTYTINVTSPETNNYQYINKQQIITVYSIIPSAFIHNQIINYNNPFGQLDDHLFYFEYNTANLIENDKLKSDCSDLRIFEKDTEILINHAIENNCNTVNTKIWMRDDLVGGLNQYILASGNPFVKNSGEKSSLSTEDNFFIQLSKHDSFEKYENDRTNFTMVAIDKVNNIDTTTAKFFFKTPASIYDFNEHTPDYDSLTNSFKYKRVLGPGEYSYYWKIKNDLGHTIESSINTFTVEKNVPNLNLKINENNIENINNIITYDNTKIDYNLIDTEGNIKIQIYDSNNNLFKTLNEFNTITEVFNFTKQGTYNIVYSFDGNNDYSQFSNSFLINVKPERISPEITIQKLETDLIEIEPNKFKYDPNKKIKFIINVTDFSGIKKTIMTINNEETEILVNSNNFETEVIYETNLDAGNYDYYWRAYDNSGNIVNGAGKLFEIEKADYELVTAISTSPEEIINKKVTDKVLIESQIFPQTNYNMKISLNGAEIENKQSISFSQELDLENEGTYTIEFSSIENNNYNPTSKIITINVEKETVPPEISSKNINAPEKYDKETNTVISINANDDYGLKDNALLILNNKEYLVPNNNGIYKFEKVLNASLYTYKWKVLDVFDNFVETEQKTFTIEKRNTHIISNIDGDNANNLNIGLSDQVIINANIMPPYLEYNMKLKYGEEEKINENENNFAEEYIFNNEGLYELNFNYIGDKNHLSNSSIHNIEVAKETEPPTITSNTFTSPNSYDSNTNTIITLSASDNYGIKNKIELILNDIIHEVNLKNENEGVYTFEFNKLLNAGNYNYKWKVLDKFDNLIETELKTFTITKKDPLLNLLINDEFLNKEIIELENIKVISKMVEPVDNYKFIIINKQDDSTYFEYDGEYEQFIAFPQSNEYDIKIVYSGNENYNEKEKKLTVTVTKEKNAPIITRNEFVYNAEYSQDKSIFIVNASDDKGIKSIAELILDQKTINVNRDANELFNYSTILSAGPHSYYWKVYDLNNNLVVTKLETFEILKKTPNIQISIDDSNVDKTIKTFEFFNIKANTIEPNNNDFNYNIYKDNQLISSGVKNNLNDLISNNQVGNYKYEIEYLGNINYSGLKKSMNLNTINEQDKPKINLIEQSSPDTYNSDKSIISLTSSDISGIKSAILNLNNELIEMELLNIEENIFKHKFEKILSAGKYNYNIIIKDNSGNEFLSETKEFIIKKAKAEFNLKLNGQNTDVNIEVGNKLNIKTDIINPSGEEYDMFIFDQNRGIIQEYTYSEYNEIEIDILNENDQYINLTFDGNENYTKSSIEYVVFFNEDITPPRINYDNLEIAMPNSPSKYEIGGKIKFEINASDFSGLKNIAKLNISNTLFDVEYNNGKYSYEIQLQSGEYKYNWIIEDNKNNKVISDTNTHKIQKNSINVTLSFKDNIIKQNTSEKIEAFVNISGNEGLPYEIFFDNEIKKYTQKEKFNITKLKSGVYNLDFKFNETENFYEKIINKTVIFVDDILPLGVKNLNEYNYSNTSTVITFETIETEDFESYEIYVNNELINTSKDINERFYKLYDFVIGTKYTAKVVTKDVNGNKVEQKIDFVFAKDYKPIKVKEIKKEIKNNLEYYIVEFNNEISEIKKENLHIKQGEKEFDKAVLFDGRILKIYPIGEIKQNEDITIRIDSGIKDKYNQTFLGIEHNIKTSISDIDGDLISDITDDDKDGDGLNDEIDNVYGTIPKHNFEVINTYIENFADINNKNYVDVKNIKFKMNENTLVSFNHNFSENKLDLTDILILQDNLNGNKIIVKNINQTGTKDISFKKINDKNNDICILDKHNATITQTTNKCTNKNEIFVQCDGKIQNNYICNIVNGWFVVMGLKNSAVQEFCSENWKYTEWSTCANSIQTREAEDLNECETIFKREELMRSCTEKIEKTKTTKSTSSSGGGSGSNKKSIFKSKLPPLITSTKNETVASKQNTNQTNVKKIIKQNNVNNNNKTSISKNISQVLKKPDSEIENKVKEIITQQPINEIQNTKSNWKLFIQIFIIILISGIFIEFSIIAFVKPKVKTKYSTNYYQPVKYSQPIVQRQSMNYIEKPRFRQINPYIKKTNLMQKVKQAIYSESESNENLKQYNQIKKENSKKNAVEIVSEIINGSNNKKNKSNQNNDGNKNTYEILNKAFDKIKLINNKSKNDIKKKNTNLINNKLTNNKINKKKNSKTILSNIIDSMNEIKNSKKKKKSNKKIK